MVTPDTQNQARYAEREHRDQFVYLDVDMSMQVIQYDFVSKPEKRMPSLRHVNRRMQVYTLHFSAVTLVKHGEVKVLNILEKRMRRLIPRWARDSKLDLHENLLAFRVCRNHPRDGQKVIAEVGFACWVEEMDAP